MSPNPKKIGTLSIQVDALGNMEVRFLGENKFLLPMMGSLSVASDYLKDKLMNGSNIGGDWGVAKTSGKKGGNEYIEEKMTKQEALGKWLEVREMIEQKLDAVAKSSDEAVFEIPVDLLSKI